MASPLKAFRKYQRQMLVFFGVLLMIAFILGGVVSTNFGRPEVREDSGRKLAVSWDGGYYDQDGLRRFRQQHQITQQFLFQLYMQARAKGVNVRVDPNLMPAGSRSADNFYSEVVILLMADEARRMGMVVGDAAIDDFLDEVGGNEFREGDYRALLRDMTKGGMSYAALRQQLQIELLAIRLQDFLLSGIGGIRAGMNPQTGVIERQTRDPYVTPVSALVAERMTNDTVKVQMMPVAVEPFLEQVKETPSRSEMRRLYAEAATKTPDLQKLRPGFRSLDKARVQWFDIRIESLTGSVGRISDAEVQAEYDARVARKDLSVIDSGLPSTDLPGGTDTPLIPPADGGDAPLPGTDPASPSDAPMPMGSGETPATETPAPTETPGPMPGDLPPAPIEPTPPGSGDGNEAPQQSSLVGDRLRFVSTDAQEAPTGDAPVPPAVPQETPVPAETPTPAETPATTETQEPMTETPAEVPPTTGDVTIPDAPVVETGTEQTPATEAEVPVRFKPLDDAMKTRIRDDLKREKARVKQGEIKETLRSRLTEYMLDLASWRDGVESGTDAEAPEPAKPNFKEWSEEFGIVFGDTEKLYDADQLRTIEIGEQPSELDFQLLQSLGRLPTVVDEVFGAGVDSVRPYEPKVTFGDSYLYWVAEASPSHVPTFEECSDEIIRFWRWEKAVELAKADAEKKLAAISGDQTLKDAFGDEVIESRPFSYWSVGGGNIGSFGQITISPVNYSKTGADGVTVTETLDDLGQEFMDPVFAAEAGGKVIGIDYRHETVYAVQVLEKETTGPLSETAVMNQTAPNPNATRIVGADIGEFLQDWFLDLEKRRNLRWTIDQ
ncbi:MAG TPA: hypothetical protein PLI18_18230 [Pirellulaceae bacterium]|nr:hypothetical protein [Pirellulaceae bacterium]